MEITKRTFLFAMDVIDFVETLPVSLAGQTIGRQLMRSGTSVAANLRSARRARPAADFAAKINIVEEEADESLFWLQLIQARNLGNQALVNNLIREADELTAIMAASGKTVKSRYKRK